MICALAPCTDGQIRLVGGVVIHEGRVEVCMDNQWGTVCDDSWDTDDTTVVCRQLGFSTTGAIPTFHVEQHQLILLVVCPTDSVPFLNSHFGSAASSVPIYYDNVACLGTESYLANCSRASSVSCTHSEDAGVRCQGEWAHMDTEPLTFVYLENWSINQCILLLPNSACSWFHYNLPEWWGSLDWRVQSLWRASRSVLWFPIWHCLWW